MTSINITDLENAKKDVDHIAEISNSTAMTAIDRMGNTKKTVVGAVYTIQSINNRGAWVSGTTYAVKDIVSVSATWYVAVIAHTASSSFATDNTKWRVYQGVTTGDLSASTGSDLVGHIGTGLGTVPVMLGAKLREQISVKDFGAKGDGTTDDTAAFVAANATGKPVLVPPGSYYITQSFDTGNKFFCNGGVTWTHSSNFRVFFKFNTDGNVKSKFSSSQTVGREELQIYSTDNNKGSGIHLYGNGDNQHAGNVALLTGQDGVSEARLIVSGGSNNTSSDGYRTNTDTHVTIGNDIWDFVDNKQDTALLNLRNPQGCPAINITLTGASEGEITVPTGQRFSLGHWDGTTFTSRGGFDSAGKFLWGNDNYAARLVDTATTPYFQVEGTSQQKSSAMLVNWSSSLTSDSGIYLAKSHGSSPGTNSAVTNTSVLGSVNFVGSDSVGFFTGAKIEASVQESDWTTTSHPTRLQIKTTSVGSVTPITRLTCNAAGSFSAGSDGTQSWGTPSYKWSVIYAGTGSINTSDIREKQQIRSLIEAEIAVATKLKGMIKAFKFNTAVAEKGNAARIHIGVMAQEVASAFVSEGLDPEDYAMFCFDEWPAEINEDGTIREAGNRYGIRYEEFLAFIISVM